MRKPSRTVSKNRYHALSAEESDSEPNNKEQPQPESSHPYTEIESNKGLFPQIKKSQRNAVTRAIRKTDAPDEKPRRGPWTLKQKKKRRIIDRYVYYHQRFQHANPNAIALFHTITNIKQIIIPDKIPLCDICAKQKLRKFANKTLAEYKNEPLALISFDVAGPFLISYRGYKYFGEIVDNWTCKKFTLLFKSRKEILPKLNQWKLNAEL